MTSPPQSRWPLTRRSLIILTLLMVGASIFTLLLGRPGDFGAGLVGLVFGAAVGMVVGLIEVIGSWSARRLTKSSSEETVSAEPSTGSNSDR